MSYLYTTYQHPSKGGWGFTDVIDGSVHTAAVDGEGGVTLGKLEPMKLGPELQRRIRGGYAKVTQPKYLHRVPRNGKLAGEFVAQHPDLGRSLQGECILFVAIAPDTQMTETVADWERRLGNCDPQPGREEWLEHCVNVTAYAPAMSNDPAAALVVAQWAHDDKLILVANAGTAPAGAPSAERHNWRTYLTNWFALEQIDQALTDLGWPLAEGLNASPVATTTTVPEGSWLQLAQQVTF
jgi:hypothetical protein